jgi:hypothetical protein
MKHLSFLLALLCLAPSLFAQQVFTIKADSTLLTGCDSNELIIENHTRNVPGFLYNTGNGRTIFKRGVIKINDSLYLIGGDTLKSNAWIQGGNRFGATGILGTWDKNNLDLYTNHTRIARLDTSGRFLIGNPLPTPDMYIMDVNGYVRAFNIVNASVGDGNDIRLFSGYGNGFATGVNGSMITFGSIWASIGVNKQTLGNIPDGSLIIGGTSPQSMEPGGQALAM